MEYKNVNDYEVVYLIRENDDEARDLMFRKYSPVIQKLALKYLSFAIKNGVEKDDLIQEGYIALNRAINNYQEDSGVLFYTYALLCIERHLITYCRNISSNKHALLNERVDEEELLYLKDLGNDPESKVLEHSLEEKFIHYKNLLDFKHSSVFELRYNGFSYKEIGKLLDLPVSTIDGRLCKIRKILQEKEKNFI